jgi:hypothetical protein
MYIKYKKKYDSRNIFLSSNSSQSSKKRKVIPSTQLSHNKIPTSITVPKAPQYKITHKELYSVNGSEPIIETMTEFMHWKYCDYYHKERSYEQYHKDYFYKMSPFLEENIKLKIAECSKELFSYYVPEIHMKIYCLDTASEDEYSEIYDKEEEYYDDDDRESLLYFHSFLQALANLYIFDLGFLSAYKMGGEKINLCPFTEHFRSYSEHYPELGVLKPYGESCVNVMISCHVKSCIITV